MMAHEGKREGLAQADVELVPGTRPVPGWKVFLKRLSW